MRVHRFQSQEYSLRRRVAITDVTPSKGAGHFLRNRQVFRESIYLLKESVAKKKMKDLQKIKDSALNDTVAELRPASEIGKIFGGFQKHLY